MTVYFFVGIGGLENSPASDWERRRSLQHWVEQRRRWDEQKARLPLSYVTRCHRGHTVGFGWDLHRLYLSTQSLPQVLLPSLNVLPHTHRHMYTAMDSGCPVNLALGMFLASSWTRTSQTTIPQPPPLLAAWCVEEMHAHSQEQLINFSKRNESQVWNLITSQKTPVDPFKSSYNLLAFTEWPCVM